MEVLVPFAVEQPKTRLSEALSVPERREFARVMLEDVLAAVRASGREPTVLATAPVEVDAPVVVDDRSLTDAVNERLGDGPVAVVMADLALVTADALEALFEPDADVVLAPGLGGGTNALVARHPAFRVDYHGASVRDHRAAAREVGATTADPDSFRLAVDVDEPGDLAEVLLHGRGEAREWLETAGFELSVTEGRVEVTRRGETV